MMASLGNFKTLKISDARKNRRRTISEIDNFKNGPVSADSIYFHIQKMFENEACLVGTDLGDIAVTGKEFFVNVRMSFPAGKSM